jgi:predicted small secreted protein
MHKILITLSLLMISSVGLAGCTNTVDGAGQDIEGMGDWVQDTF